MITLSIMINSKIGNNNVKGKERYFKNKFKYKHLVSIYFEPAKLIQNIVAVFSPK